LGRRPRRLKNLGVKQAIRFLRGGATVVAAIGHSMITYYDEESAAARFTRPLLKNLGNISQHHVQLRELSLHFHMARFVSVTRVINAQKVR
jgi:hypothetical protein